ncbi:MAG: F0F1 ATP synthase subunit A [Mangrovibacterium sp.]
MSSVNYMINHSPKWFKFMVLTLAFTGLSGIHAFASGESSFDVGKFTMEEVTDQHEWHIMDIGDKSVSIPLPVIVYSAHSGFHVFMSSKFEHGHAAYKRFELGEKAPYEGKIIEKLDNGELYVPWDFSITKVVIGLLLSVVILLWIFLSVAKSMKAREGKTPKGIQNAMEPMITFVRDDVAIPCIGEAKYERYMPYLLTLFFFILFNNIIGLIPVPPFGANVTGNISITMCLAAFTFVLTSVSANKHYWKEIYNPDVPWWMKFPIPLMPFIELLGLIIKPVVLMIRLFANILAGHLVVAVFIALIFVFTNIMGATAGAGVSIFSVGLSVFIKLLDVLVAFIQAFVFTLLSALYIGTAIQEHHS